ncbi:MAG: serine/threonine protein kinase, partial [Candidatus Xenobia bacterium]
MLICVACGTENDDDALACKSCSDRLTQKKKSPGGRFVLPQGTMLQRGAYKIETVLGQGGFGITYLGRNLEGNIAIKEFFPQGSTRRGSEVEPPGNMTEEDFQKAKDRYLDEARILRQFNHR